MSSGDSNYVEITETFLTTL